MKILEIVPNIPEDRKPYIHFSCQLIRKDQDQVENVCELWYEIPKEFQPTWRDEDVEPYLIAVILQAMYEDRKIVAKGTVSAELLSNLTEFSGFWNNCLPDVYNKIEIECDKTEDDEHTRPVKKAIAAFSGGLDATFLIWQHAKRKAGYRTQPLSACVMIHGLDIYLSNEKFFEMSFSSAQKTLKTVGLPLIPVRTNIKDLLTVSLAHHHGTTLVSAFQFLKSQFGIALISGSMPYATLEHPWGTSPLTDHLLSSSMLKILHDGACYGRLEKAKELVEWHEGVNHLRVCLSTEGLHSLNCGRCEKCIRTIACFAVNRLPIPESLNADLAVLNKRLRFFRFHSPGHRAEWVQLLREAKKNKIHDPWVKWILWLMLKYRIRQIKKGIKGYLKIKFRLLQQ